MIMFSSEAALVSDFVVRLAESRTWGVRKVATEFFYGRGRTDVVGVLDGGGVIAIEAKLMRWRHAVQQAYRNRCFAHKSCVLLPRAVAYSAVRFCAEFERRGVGLCTLSGEEIEILIEPPRSEPLQPWLSALAEELASGGELAGDPT
ncbi:MAG: hypothetical protein IPQ07_40110 [Myxococcales bacterium]|nr:hypothetical protein [Myxococcales bacterium]